MIDIGSLSQSIKKDTLKRNFDVSFCHKIAKIHCRIKHKWTKTIIFAPKTEINLKIYTN